MYGCERWTIKKAGCRRVDAFGLWCWRRLESPLDSKEIKPVNSKGNRPWIFIGRTEAETPILWPPDVKSWLTGKDLDAGKDWGKKGATEDEMVAWHHWLNGHELEQTQGDSEGQGSLACCCSRGCRELDTTQRLNNNHWRREGLTRVLWAPGGPPDWWSRTPLSPVGPSLSEMFKPASPVLLPFGAPEGSLCPGHGLTLSAASSPMASWHFCLFASASVSDLHVWSVSLLITSPSPLFFKWLWAPPIQRPG